MRELREQLNTLKEGSGKCTDVAINLQLVRQLASAPLHLRDPHAIFAALQKLADEARVSGDPSALRYEAILRQTRLLSSSSEFGFIIIRLVDSKEESEVARQCPDNGFSVISIPMPGGIHHNARPLTLGVSRLTVPVEVGESVLTAVRVGTFKDSVILFYLKWLSLKMCEIYFCLYFLLIVAPPLHTSFVVPWVRVSNAFYASVRLLKAGNPGGLSSLSLLGFPLFCFRNRFLVSRLILSSLRPLLANHRLVSHRSGVIGRVNPLVLLAHSPRLNRWRPCAFGLVQVCLPSDTLLFFVPRQLHNNIAHWVFVADHFPPEEEPLCFIRDKVDVASFIVPFKGKFAGKFFDAPYPLFVLSLRNLFPLRQ